MSKLYIIGAGPGTLDYLLPAAIREIEKADCLIGAKRILAQFYSPDQKKIYLEGHFKEAGSFIKKNKDKKRIVLLVSGDPGLYSFLRQVELILKKKEYIIIPGISTLQLAFARMGESWQDAKIISVHGRPPGNLAEEVNAAAKVFLLTDRKFPPQKIAGYLLERGIKNRKTVVFENLSYADERIVKTNLISLSKMRGFGLCVMVVTK
ncbi:MAG: precorrin-6y C5,15-methyltransferase (decarboxylating) subunit CbiE [Candidatus Omnitrophota bacterium]|nr:precorrin-6y C5,15-methyltransferase (decarboxylating) subunit CbiE [Candidatus Omnitrophota bacterium]